MSEEFKSDSYVINVTRPGTRYPMIEIIRRKKKRERGKVDAEVKVCWDVGEPLYENAFEEDMLEEAYKKLGKAIFEDSCIIQDFIKKQKHNR